METSILNKKSISVTTSKPVQALKTVDGWIVQMSTTLVRPDSDCFIFSNLLGHTDPFAVSEVALWRSVVAMSTRVRAGNPAESGRSAYWDAPGRSMYAEAMPIVVVKEDPSLWTGCLRPSPLGTGVLSQFLRSLKVPLLSIAVNRLPSAIALGAGLSIPHISYYERIFGDFCGELWPGWSTDTKTPDLQHPGYGTYLASLVSQALVVLCSTNYTSEEKRPLATRMVQWGWDLAGAWADGRDHTANGGHMLGRKALILLAGFLLDAEPLKHPAAYIANRFAEDDAFAPGRSWFGEDNVSWTHSGVSDFGTNPEEWSEVARWKFSYAEQVIGATIGTVVAMRLLGLGDSFGLTACKTVDWWMGKFGASSQSDILKIRPETTFGHDYSLVGGGGMCAEAWRQLA